MGKKTLQWHPAFQAALQLELDEDRPYLSFLEEYNLSKKPLQMDTLIIKQKPDHVVAKSIGRIFRQFNVVEYKSPEDYVSINDFYKVMGYACIYQSNTKKVMEIPPEELTVSFVCSCYPAVLIKHLEEMYRIGLRMEYEGIYYVDGLMFPMQILITNRLPKEEYIWLSRLGKNLELKEDIEPLARAYKGNETDPLYQAVMDLIIRANWEKYEEVRDMCEALRELFADELAEREERGLERGLENGIERGTRLKLISIVRKKLEKGLSASEIAELLEEEEDAVHRIYSAIQEHAGCTDEEVYELCFK
ncbi:3-isopropylmalate dehydrogenase [Clostridium sp. MCC353]|uniref:3-isopropylmalate dehydrogenase n=1 Tax=Clostridium sp. MCC353 TaxID=2592646 RepID=UPI001C017AD1|nr:3-isopropylmalate dehydrogenase [Clostridium sp. MCC353]MBT9775052.1 3-isopropylmalate dehydrogenase [Clostridium sp. MCC353]